MARGLGLCATCHERRSRVLTETPTMRVMIDSAMVEAKLTTKDVEWLSKPVAEADLNAKEVEWLSKVKKWCAEECQIKEGQCLGGLCLDPCHSIMKFDTCDQVVNHLVKCRRFHTLGGFGIFRRSLRQRLFSSLFYTRRFTPITLILIL